MRRAAPWAVLLVIGLGCNRLRTLDPHAPKLVYRTAPEATDRTMQVLRARLDRMKIASRVEREGDAIVVAVEADAFEQAHRVLDKQGKLEFVMVDVTPDANAAAAAITLPPEATLEHVSWISANRDSFAQAFFRAGSRAPLLAVAKLVPPKWRFAIQHNTKYDGTEEWLGMLLSTTTPIDNGAIQDAEVTFDSQTNRPEVNVTLTPTAANEFAKLTSENLGAKLAIVLDGEIQSAPIIQSRIPGGKVRITLGAGDPVQMQQEAKDLVAVLRVGALPAPLELIRMENK